MTEATDTTTADASRAADLDLQPGDVILYPFGMRRELDEIVLHGVHRYDNGSYSIRYRFASNPRGIDWQGFIDADDPDVKIVRRGETVDANIRSLLP